MSSPISRFRSIRLSPAALRFVTVGWFGMAAAYAVVAWHIVFVARIGPAVTEIDAAAGHGVHAGDVLALPLVVLAILAGVAGIGFLHLAEKRSTFHHALAHRGSKGPAHRLV